MKLTFLPNIGKTQWINLYLLAICLLVSKGVFGQNDWQQTPFNAPIPILAQDGRGGDRYGWSVSIDGNYAIVGSPQTLNDSPGAAYIYFNNNGTWVEKQKIVSSDGKNGAASSHFGFSVAISGNYAIVGRPGDDDIGIDAGAAYIFEKNEDGEWKEKVKLIPNDIKAGDSFGYAVAIDENRAVIGAIEVEDKGAAYVYLRNSVGEWVLEDTLLASDGTSAPGGKLGDLFGESVAIDQDHIIVGAKTDDIGANENQGSAYIFKYNGDKWDEVIKITDPKGDVQEVFGSSVSISGNYAVVGAPGDSDETKGTSVGSAFIYEYSNGTWVLDEKILNPDANITGGFANAVAISNKTIIFGAMADNTHGNAAGSALIYQKVGTDWVRDDNIFANDAAPRDRFGHSVDIDGKNLIVGAYGNDFGGLDERGTAYIFSNSLLANSIVVKKIATPQDETKFTFSGDFGSFDLMSGEDTLINNISVGQYTISENATTGWIIDDIQIDGDLDNGSVRNGSEITIDLDTGEYINIAFNNILDSDVTNKPPTIQVIEKTGKINDEIFFESSDFTEKFTDPDGDEVSKVMIVNLPPYGTLKFDGEAVSAGQEIKISEIDKLSLNLDGISVCEFSFDYKASDGNLYSKNSAKIQIKVNSDLAINNKSEIEFMDGNSSSGTTIWIEVNDPTLVSSCQIFYRCLSRSNDYIEEIIEPEGNRFSFNLTKDFDPFGIDYYFKILNSCGVDADSTNIKRVYINYPTGININVASGKGNTDYRPFSVPLVLTDKGVSEVLDEFGGYDKTKWRLYTSNSTSNDYLEFNGSGNFNIQPGKGYLLLHTFNDITQINTGEGNTKVTGTDTIEMNVNPGAWNLIGNPFNFEVDWSDVNQTGIGTELFEYSPNWDRLSSTLKRNSSAMVWVESEITTLEIPVLSNTQGKRVSNTLSFMHNQLDEPNWEVNLQIKGGGLQRTYGGFGMNTEASLSKDPFDIMTPPPFGNYLDIRFPHKEYSYPYFTRDVVPTQEEYIWEFEIATDITEDMLTFNWYNSYFGTSDKELVLYDVTNQNLIDMYHNDSYSFWSGQSSKFKVYYGNQTFIEQSIMPEKLILGKAYPNPFTGSIYIPFSIPNTNEDYHVSLKIYDFLGRVIEEVINGYYQAGIYKGSWDGSKLPVGIYFYSLEASNSKYSMFIKNKLLKR